MNKLELVQRLSLEAGASGTVSTTIGQQGESLRLVTWIDQAWQDIQRMNDQWKWLRRTLAPANLVQDQSTYTPADLGLTDFGDWLNGSFRIYQTTIDNEQILTQYPYEKFRNTYIYGTTSNTSGYPIAITVVPDKSLRLALQPDSNSYFLTGEYYAKPSVMSADTDVPEMPERYHIMIVWSALVDYGGYESSPEAYSRAQQRYTELKDDLRINQGPELTINRSFLS